MRRASNVDREQAAIVEALRAIGCSVQSLAFVGSGCPDLLVGYRSRNWLLEVKSPIGKRGGEHHSGQALRPIQREWHESWRGQAAVVRSVEEAVVVVTEAMKGEAA